jgi:hypothetical protein
MCLDNTGACMLGQWLFCIYTSHALTSLLFLLPSGGASLVLVDSSDESEGDDQLGELEQEIDVMDAEPPRASSAGQRLSFTFTQR